MKPRGMYLPPHLQQIYTVRNATLICENDVWQVWRKGLCGSRCYLVFGYKTTKPSSRHENFHPVMEYSKNEPQWFIELATKFKNQKEISDKLLKYLSNSRNKGKALSFHMGSLELLFRQVPVPWKRYDFPNKMALLLAIETKFGSRNNTEPIAYLAKDWLQEAKRFMKNLSPNWR